MMRPPMYNRATAASVISSTSYSPSEGTCTDETALTTPDLSSPPSKMGGFDYSFSGSTYPTPSSESLATLLPTKSRREEPKSPAETQSTSEMARGPSVKERASVFEPADRHPKAPPRVMMEGLAQPVPRRPTAPLRIGHRSPAHKASKVVLESVINPASPSRRKPVPQAVDTPSSPEVLDHATLPLGLGVQFDPLSAGPSTQAAPSPTTPMSRATTSYFAVGKDTSNIRQADTRQEPMMEYPGSAKLLIKHWENRPSADQHLRDTAKTQVQPAYRSSQPHYLNSKPLPTPGKMVGSRDYQSDDVADQRARTAVRSASNYAPMRTIDGRASSLSSRSPARAASDRLTTPLPATERMRTPSPTMSIRSGPSYGPESPTPRRGLGAVSPMKGAISKLKDFGRRARDKGKTADVLGGLLSNVVERKASRAYAHTERGPESDDRFGSAGLPNGIVYLDDLRDAPPDSSRTERHDLGAEEKPLDWLGKSPDGVSLSQEQQIRSSLESLLGPVKVDRSGPRSIESVRTLDASANQVVPHAIAAIPTQSSCHLALEQQPTSERELSIFRQTPSGRSQHLSRVRPPSGSAVDNDPVASGKSPPPSTECVLDFDPADLNPSRSASQVRRPASEFTTTAAQADFTGLGDAPFWGQFALEEDREPSLGRQLTHISRVAFPEPQIHHSLSRQGLQPAPPPADGGNLPDTEWADNQAAQGVQRLPAPSAAPPSLLPSNARENAGKEQPLAARLQAIQTELQRLALKIDRVVTARGSAGPSSLNDPALSARLASIELAVQDTRNTLLQSRPAEEGPEQRPVIDESALASIHSKLELILHSRGQADALTAEPHADLTVPGLEKKGQDPPVKPVLLGVTPETTEEENGANAKTPMVIANECPTSQTPGLPAIRDAKTVRKPKAKAAALGVVSRENGLSLVEVVAATVSEGSEKLSVKEEQPAGEEVAKIMSNVAAVTDDGLPHSARSYTKPEEPSGEQGVKSDDENKTLPDAIAKQLGDVVKQVTELNEARTLQMQNSNDIVKYLTKMDVWLETLVKNMGEGIESIGSTLTGGIPQAGAVAATPASLVGLVLDLQSTMKSFQASEASRNETFTAMIQENRQRMLGLTTVVEQMRAALSQQQAANEQMLQSLSSDQKSIKGEMVRFVEAMKEAVAFDVEARVGRFEQLASYEVNKAISQVSDLSRQHGKLLGNLAVLHSMHTTDAPQGLIAQAPRTITSAEGVTAASSKPALPLSAGRGLPPAPGAKSNLKGKK